jgi:hypothetical protein
MTEQETKADKRIESNIMAPESNDKTIHVLPVGPSRYEPTHSAPTAGLHFRVIACFHCGKAVTPAFPWDEDNGPFPVRGIVECPECIESQPG